MGVRVAEEDDWPSEGAPDCDIEACDCADVDGITGGDFADLDIVICSAVVRITKSCLRTVSFESDGKITIVVGDALSRTGFVEL